MQGVKYRIQGHGFGRLYNLREGDKITLKKACPKCIVLINSKIANII